MNDAEQDSLLPVARRALELVREGSVIGLGTGRAADCFIRVLGERVRSGFRVKGVPTSGATAALASQQGIPLVSLDDVDAVDLVVDGADEIDPHLDLIKGYGGALVREKVVAAAARRLVIVAGAEKLVAVLGSRGRLPVEVMPFALPLCRREIGKRSLAPELRLQDGRPFLTDNGNYILDCATGPIANAGELDGSLLSIPGVVGTGLFIGLATAAVIGDVGGVRTIERAT